jgi:predicted transcriptional regulator
MDLPNNKPPPDNTPHYFTRHQKRTDDRVTKLVRAMLAHIEDEDSNNNVKLAMEEILETALPAAEKCGIPIHITYEEAVNNPIHGEGWNAIVMAETL